MKRTTWDQIVAACKRWRYPETEWPDPGDLVAIEAEGVKRAERERLGLERTPIALMHGVELCPARPANHLSPCLRVVEHRGMHVLAVRTRVGARFYVAADDGEPVECGEITIRYPEPSRLELAEHWAWREETTAQGREAVGR